MRFKNYGLAPKSAADFAFLLHGFHYLEDDGVMAIILPHGVLFRGGAEAKIRRKLLERRPHRHRDRPAREFVLLNRHPCLHPRPEEVQKASEDVLFINASEHFEKGKRQNYLSDGHIAKIIDTYQQRPEGIERYARRVEMDEIEANDFNLNISRYVSTARESEAEVDLASVRQQLDDLRKQVRSAAQRHNGYLEELGVPTLP